MIIGSMIIGTHIGSRLFVIIIMFNDNLTFELYVITDNIFYLRLKARFHWMEIY